MRGAIVFAVGAALLLLALLGMAPASLVDGRIDAASAGRFRLTGTAGTIWNGSGELRMLPSGVGLPVSWQIDAWPLLHGELRGTLSTGASGGTQAQAPTPAAFVVSTREAELRNFALGVPMSAVLAAAGVPPALVGASGSVSVRIAVLARRADRMDGQVALRWDQATLRAASFATRPGLQLALGDVRYDGAGQGNAVVGTLANTGGDVEISGDASATLNGTARIEVLIRPRAGIDAERANAIGNALAAVGRPDGNGGYRISWAR
jgi:general secretion pathway protein N